MRDLFAGADDGLCLSALTEDDIELARGARNSPRIRTRTREYRPLTVHDQAQWFQRISAPDTRDFMFAVRQSGSTPAAVSAGSSPSSDWLGQNHDDVIECSLSVSSITRTVGVVGLCHWEPRDRTAETSFYLTEPEYERRGWMTRALGILHEWGFQELGLERIWAEVYAFNAPGLALLTTLGFREEGRLRQHVYRLGERHDSVMLGLLRSEWEEQSGIDTTV